MELKKLEFNVVLKDGAVATKLWIDYEEYIYYKQFREEAEARLGEIYSKLFGQLKDEDNDTRKQCI